jgi:hypothetical protein
LTGSGEQAQLPTKLLKRYATLAQLVEQLTRNEQVRSSILLGGSLQIQRQQAQKTDSPLCYEMERVVTLSNLLSTLPQADIKNSRCVGFIFAFLDFELQHNKGRTDHTKGGPK